MNTFWSQTARALSPYVPGEQPRIANLVKLNTNESPFGPRRWRWRQCGRPRPIRCGSIPTRQRRSCARRLPPITA